MKEDEPSIREVQKMTRPQATSATLPSIPDTLAREMFGCTSQSIDEALRGKAPRDITRYVMGLLSYVQELTQWEVPNEHLAVMIRQLMNIAKYAIDKAVPGDARPEGPEGAATAAAAAVTVMGLCETEMLFLHPNQTYRFEVMPGCRRCEELAQHSAWPRSPGVGGPKSSETRRIPEDAR